MIIIHLARKPLSEPSVAANVLKHGTGGLNVDGCRIGLDSGESLHREPMVKAGGRGSGGWKNTSEKTGSMTDDWKKGRWPANLILEHRKRCRIIGEKRVRASKEGAGKLWSHYRNGTEDQARVKPSRIADQAGMETVEAWDCEEGCPVVLLDTQSGELKSGKLQPHHRRNVPRLGHGGCYGDDAGGDLATTGETYGGDKGGASRFFKQVQDKSE